MQCKTSDEKPTQDTTTYIEPIVSVYGLPLKRVSQDQNQFCLVQMLHCNQTLRRFACSFLHRKQCTIGKKMKDDNDGTIGNINIKNDKFNFLNRFNFACRDCKSLAKISKIHNPLLIGFIRFVNYNNNNNNTNNNNEYHFRQLFEWIVSTGEMKKSKNKCKMTKKHLINTLKFILQLEKLMGQNDSKQFSKLWSKYGRISGFLNDCVEMFRISSFHT